MEIIVKILSAVSMVVLLISVLAKADKKIGKIDTKQWQRFWRSLLYAFVFTPTIYHHAPNTIIAPLHLPTVCGNLFYGYEYTFPMFAYGVILPVLCGWAGIFLFMIFREKRHNSMIPMSL